MIDNEFKTDRLILRDLSEKDAGDVYNLFSNPETMYFLDLPHPNIEHSKKYIDDLLIAYQEQPRLCWEMAVILKSTQEFIGVVNLGIETPYIKDGRACLDYYFFPEYWNKGYATEASRALIKFAFETLEINKIATGCFKCNSASEKVMIKCGMSKEAELKKHAKFNGEWENRVEYAILKDEYFEIKNKKGG